MRPSQIASALLEVADGISSSRRPSRTLVASDLRRIMLAFSIDAFKLRKDLLEAMNGLSPSSLPRQQKLNLPEFDELDQIGVPIYVGVKWGQFYAKIGRESPAYMAPVGEFDAGEAADAVSDDLMTAIGQAAGMA